MATRETTKQPSAARTNAAVDAIMPLMPGLPMVRIILSQQRWSPEEIEDHLPALLRALADRFAEGEA